MRINITKIHDGLAIFRNWMLLLAHSFEELGHSVIISESQLRLDCFNVIFFSTLPPIKDLETLKDANCDFAFVSMELFNGSGWELTKFSPAELQAFEKFCNKAKFVISFYQRELPHYQKIIPHIYYTPYGYNSRLDTIRSAHEKFIDVFFFGSLADNPYRREILAKLQASGLDVAFSDNGGHDIVRDSMIAASKLVLCLPHSPKQSFFSYRPVWLANNHVCSVTNQITDPDQYFEYSHMTGDRDFVAECHALISGNKMPDKGEAVYEKLKQNPMSKRLEFVLDSALIGRSK